MKIEEIESSQITVMVIVAIVAILIIWMTLSVQQYNINETKAFLDAGCESTYVPGRNEKAWVNCKCLGGENK